MRNLPHKANKEEDSPKKFKFIYSLTNLGTSFEQHQYYNDTGSILHQIKTLGKLYLTHDIDFSIFSLKSDLGFVALVWVCSKLFYEYLFFFKFSSPDQTFRSPGQSATNGRI